MGSCFKENVEATAYSLQSKNLPPLLYDRPVVMCLFLEAREVLISNFSKLLWIFEAKLFLKCPPEFFRKATSPAHCVSSLPAFFFFSRWFTAHPSPQISPGELEILVGSYVPEWVLYPNTGLSSFALSASSVTSHGVTLLAAQEGTLQRTERYEKQSVLSLLRRKQMQQVYQNNIRDSRQ